MNDVIKKNNNIFHYVNYLNEENHFKPIISSENKDFKYVKPKETIKVQKNQNKKGVQRG